MSNEMLRLEPPLTFSQKKSCEYKFHTGSQSPEPDFDYLKSIEIEEKINKIKWCKRQNTSHSLPSTKDKTIKLWKVFEKSLEVVAENNLSHGTQRRQLQARDASPKFRSILSISQHWSAETMALLQGCQNRMFRLAAICLAYVLV